MVRMGNLSRGLSVLRMTTLLEQITLRCGSTGAHQATEGSKRGDQEVSAQDNAP